mgnify:CR=1 FL=1
MATYALPGGSAGVVEMREYLVALPADFKEKQDVRLLKQIVPEEAHRGSPGSRSHRRHVSTARERREQLPLPGSMVSHQDPAFPYPRTADETV